MGDHTPLQRSNHSYLNHFDMSIQLIGILSSRLMDYVLDIISAPHRRGNWVMAPSPRAAAIGSRGNASPGLLMLSFGCHGV